METPARRTATVGNDVLRTPSSAARPAGWARMVLAAGTVLAAAACGFAAPVQDPPADPVPYDEVVGLWENGHGATIEFREDGTYTAVGSTFGASGRIEVPAGEFDGSWRLCESIYGTLNGEEVRSPVCAESEKGEWIVLGADGSLGMDNLLFTEDEEIELYPYALEIPTHSDDYYTKAD